MTGLEGKLCATKPRESDGARTGARFAFQAHVSISKILEWHEQGIDYVALFDLYDDLTLIDQSTQPPCLHFFQIKGKGKGSWTSRALATPKGEAPQTIVGKMYYNVHEFGEYRAIASFVANAPFNFTLRDGRKTNNDDVLVELNKLGAKDLEVISQGLQLDFPAPRKPDELHVLRFEVTKIPTRHYEEMLLGEIVKTCSANSSAIGLYKTLVAEVTKRANDTQECNSIEEIYERKSLSRVQLSKLFETAKTRISILDAWNTIDAELIAAGRTLGQRIGFRTQLVRYFERVSRNERAATELAEFIREVVQTNTALITSAKTYLDAIETLQIEVYRAGVRAADAQEIDVALLVEIHDAL